MYDFCQGADICKNVAQMQKYVAVSCKAVEKENTYVIIKTRRNKKENAIVANNENDV